jgi:hypothetical protein
MIAGGAVIAAVLAVLGTLAFTQNSGSGAQATPTPETVAGPPIHGIKCEPEMATYHVHAHLTLLDGGKPVTVPAYIGQDINNDCLYWLHTHNPDGIIHVEAPQKIEPTLGTFFDIWKKTLDESSVPPLRAKAGQQTKVFVNQKPYTGNPRSIKLLRHTDIEIQVGPPFKKPQKYQYGQL